MAIKSSFVRPLHSETCYMLYASDSATAAQLRRLSALLSPCPKERNASVIKHIEEFAGDEPNGLTLG